MPDNKYCKQKLGVLFFTCIKLVVHVLACVCVIAHIKWRRLHIVVSVSMDFPSNSQQDAPFHCIGYDYSSACWNSLCDHLRDVQWEDIFKLSASTVASEFCEWQTFQ